MQGIQQAQKNPEVPSAHYVPDTGCISNKAWMFSKTKGVLHEQFPKPSTGVCLQQSRSNTNVTFVRFWNGPKGTRIPRGLTLLSFDSYLIS